MLLTDSEFVKFVNNTTPQNGAIIVGDQDYFLSDLIDEEEIGFTRLIIVSEYNNKEFNEYRDEFPEINFVENSTVAQTATECKDNISVVYVHSKGSAFWIRHDVAEIMSSEKLQKDTLIIIEFDSFDKDYDHKYLSKYLKSDKFKAKLIKQEFEEGGDVCLETAIYVYKLEEKPQQRKRKNECTCNNENTKRLKILEEKLQKIIDVIGS